MDSMCPELNQALSMYIISTNMHYETVIIISIPQKWKLEIREVNNPPHTASKRIRSFGTQVSGCYGLG